MNDVDDIRKMSMSNFHKMSYDSNRQLRVVRLRWALSLPPHLILPIPVHE